MTRRAQQREMIEDPVAAAEAARIEKLEAFAERLVEKRTEAIDGRASAGIEAIWDEDEEYYDGVDELNARPGWEKPTTSSGGLTRAKGATTRRSNAFPNITQVYTEIAAAAIADMLLPTDDMPFGILATPMPDVAAATEDNTPIIVPGKPPATAGDLAKKMIAEATEAALKAEKRIWDWLTEAHWHAEARKLIHESAKIGCSVLKGPFPIKKRAKRIDREAGGEAKLTIFERTQPCSKQISPRNLYPDPACGENIQDGEYIWEEDTITRRKLRDLKGMLDADGEPMYIDSQIDLVLAEGPNNTKDTKRRGKTDESDKDKFRIWYFTGTATAEDMEAAGCKCEPSAAIPVLVTMVNDRVIKATISTLDSGEFPYDVMVWQRVPGKWWGKGEARKLRTPQRMLIAATRAMMNNGGLSSGLQIVMFRDAVTPADNSWEITPNKIWWAKSGAELKDIRNALTGIEFPDRQASLMGIIKFALELADRVATMPIQQQGQQGVTQETAEGRRLLQNNANVNKRRLAKLFDDLITEQHIERYYEWLLLHGEDTAEKGDFQIDARGSTALYERDAENQAVLQMAPLVEKKEYKINPAKWIVEAFKAQKLDPKRFQYTDEEWKKIAEEEAKKPPPKAPAVEAAEIRAKASVEVAKSRDATIVEKSRLDVDRDTAYEEALNERERIEREFNERELEMKERLAMYQENGKMRREMDKLNAKLAETVMELKTQRELAKNMQRGAPQVRRTKMEPVGRAPPGEAFQK